jgi:hypothetical protein
MTSVATSIPVGIPSVVLHRLLVLLALANCASEVIAETESRQLAEDLWRFNDGYGSKSFGCAVGKWGIECRDCLKGINVLTSQMEVCSGHGACDGEGTPYGTGECLCETGDMFST